MQKEKSKIEEIISLTLDHQKCMLEHLHASQNYVKAGAEVTATRYAINKAGQRLSAIRFEMD